MKLFNKAKAGDAVSEVAVEKNDLKAEQTEEKKQPIPAKVPQPVQTKKRRKADLATRKANKGWFFVLPFVIGMVASYLPVVIDSVCFGCSKIG